MPHGKPRYLNAVTALVFFTLSCCFFAQGAQAQSLIDGTDPQAILNIASGYGSAELTTSSTNNPMIRGRIEDTAYLVIFHGCSNGRNCKFIAFGTAWNTNRVSLRDINAWNRDRHFGKAYLDADEQPVLEMVVNLDRGVSRANLDDTFDWWKAILKNFKEQLNL